MNINDHLNSFSGTVLVVDDVQVNQLIASAMLETLGFDVVTANNGLEAVNKYSSQAFTFILMDCQMPVMDGFEASREIRKLEGTTHTPVIALTALAMSGDRELCLSAGMDDYITKPYSIEDLISCFKKWI